MVLNRVCARQHRATTVVSRVDAETDTVPAAFVLFVACFPRALCAITAWRALRCAAASTRCPSWTTLSVPGGSRHCFSPCHSPSTRLDLAASGDGNRDLGQDMNVSPTTALTEAFSFHMPGVTNMTHGHRLPNNECTYKFSTFHRQRFLTRFSGGEIEDCGVGLRQQYTMGYRMNEPNGEMDINLVTECDNRDLVDFDFRTCEYNTYMCCWTENDDSGVGDNTVSFAASSWEAILYIYYITIRLMSPTSWLMNASASYGVRFVFYILRIYFWPLSPNTPFHDLKPRKCIHHVQFMRPTNGMTPCSL